MTFDHITFSMAFRNVDPSDARFGAVTELTFGGVTYVEADGESPKDVAVMHMAYKVIGHKDIVAEFGKVYPVPSTFKLIGRTTPDDQGAP